jgi:hypothetical protein
VGLKFILDPRRPLYSELLSRRHNGLGRKQLPATKMGKRPNKGCKEVLNGHERAGIVVAVPFYPYGLFFVAAAVVVVSLSLFSRRRLRSRRAKRGERAALGCRTERRTDLNVKRRRRPQVTRISVVSTKHNILTQKKTCPSGLSGKHCPFS